MSKPTQSLVQHDPILHAYIVAIGTSSTGVDTVKLLEIVEWPARQKAQCGHCEGRQARLKMSSLEIRPTAAFGCGNALKK